MSVVTDPGVVKTIVRIRATLQAGSSAPSLAAACDASWQAGRARQDRHFDGFAGSLAGQGLSVPTLAAIVLEAGGAALVIQGCLARPAAVVLIALTVAATLLAHDCWPFEASARWMQRIQFMKNLGPIGGFLLLIAAGPGRCSLDRARGQSVRASPRADPERNRCIKLCQAGMLPQILTLSARL